MEVFWLVQHCWHYELTVVYRYFWCQKGKNSPQIKFLLVMRKHPQLATMKFAGKITVCSWVHNNSFRVFFWQQMHSTSHWQGNSRVFFKTQWKATGIHMLCHRALFEVMCILSVPTTAVQWTLEVYGLHYFWERCRKVYKWRKLQQPRSAPYAATLLWLSVIALKTHNYCLPTAARNNWPWWQEQHVGTSLHPESKCIALSQLCCDLPVIQT